MSIEIINSSDIVTYDFFNKIYNPPNQLSNYANITANIIDKSLKN